MHAWVYFDVWEYLVQWTLIRITEGQIYRLSCHSLHTYIAIHGTWYKSSYVLIKCRAQHIATNCSRQTKTLLAILKRLCLIIALIPYKNKLNLFWYIVYDSQNFYYLHGTIYLKNTTYQLLLGTNQLSVHW